MVHESILPVCIPQANGHKLNSDADVQVDQMRAAGEPERSATLEAIDAQVGLDPSVIETTAWLKEVTGLEARVVPWKAFVEDMLTWDAVKDFVSEQEAMVAAEEA